MTQTYVSLESHQEMFWPSTFGQVKRKTKQEYCFIKTQLGSDQSDFLSEEHRV